MKAVLTRIGLFLATNLAVLLLFSLITRVFGLDRWLVSGGVSYGALLVFAALLGFGGSFVSLALSKWMAKMATGAKVIRAPSTETEHWLVSTVQRLSSQAGIGMPEVAIYDAPDPNAFATGMRRDASLVAVSTGLMRAMNRKEVEAVLAHEVSHIANGDMVTLTLIQGVVNTFVIFLSRVIGSVVDKAVFKTERGRGPGYWLTVMVTELLLGLLATMLVMWFSRRREFRADAGAAALVGPEPMIAALQRLQSAHGAAALPASLSAFGIRGGPASGLRRLFLSHPPLEDRIDALSGELQRR